MIATHGRSASIALALFGLTCATAPDVAQAATAPAEVSIPNSRLVNFTSRVNGHAYSISVALPSTPPPAKGYPVLYVLDGYAYFASATEAIRQNAPNVVVVGVGYPDDPAFFAEVTRRHSPISPLLAQGSPATVAYSVERIYDLSLPLTEELMAAQSIPGMQLGHAKDTGGLDDLLKTIETEVKPRVAAMIKVDPANQALFGHSLGGLAVVRALFTEPTAFRTYIAASPSIWWGNNAVLADEARFAAAVNAGAASPRILLTVGAEEDVVPKLPAALGIDPAKVAALVAQARMVDNARDLTARLKALHGTGPYAVDEVGVFAEQGHGQAPWPAIGRAISFAFPADN